MWSKDAGALTNEQNNLASVYFTLSLSVSLCPHDLWISTLRSRQQTQTCKQVIHLFKVETLWFMGFILFHLSSQKMKSPINDL